MPGRVPDPVAPALVDPVVPALVVPEPREALPAVLAVLAPQPVPAARRARTCRVGPVAGTIRVSRFPARACVLVVPVVLVAPAADPVVLVVAVPAVAARAALAAVVARLVRSASPRASVVVRSRSSPRRR